MGCARMGAAEVVKNPIVGVCLKIKSVEFLDDPKCFTIAFKA